MAARQLNPARKMFRRFLLACLFFSFAFLFTIIILRIAYKDKNLPSDMAAFFLKADVVQHQVWAFVSDDAQDMRIAEDLLRLGFISRIYSDAGFQMIREKADGGYPPAIQRLAYYTRPLVDTSLAQQEPLPPAVLDQNAPVQGK